MTDTLGLLAAIEHLYEQVVIDPENWHEQAFADWAQDLAPDGMTKDQARFVRRALKMAERLRDFWIDPSTTVPIEDWVSQVDIALGPRAWRPTLDLAMAGLEHDPSPELFDDVKRRFRIVNSEHWMDGVTYEEWVEHTIAP